MEHKTYKREAAAVFAAYVAVLFTVAVWNDPASAEGIARFLTPFAVTLGGFALGLDWKSKQAK